ncbi:acyltransferase [Brachybacterium sacelli]|uniref:Surface polysaccharide O-acyltransferase-like enzyme n=1 Tax=Brachybacterium sacelli TaxID=173364 RepID=A0ABS4X5B9_9MICO|nr:acyltransferase [Brachybacterium sacelli]MBP2383531.1 surface polysaccharide O-acyltransferase-like enzyme [Brachybacterium sacelli]
MTPPDPAPRPRRYSPLLDVIRIVAVLGVVCVHVIADHLDPGSGVAMYALRSLLATTVPAFIMISGALNLAPAAMRHGSARFLGRRLRRLVPATIVWTAFYVVVMGLGLAGEPLEWRQEAADLLTASSYPHLYFLPLILGLTVITPVIAAYIGDSGRRAWICGGVAAGWALVVMAVPTLSAGLLREPLVPLEMGILTYFLPFIGYYVLGRAAWTAPVGRRGALALLLVTAPAAAVATVWAYLSRTTDTPPGQVLLPTYVAPTVMLLSLALVIALMGLGRDWTARPRAERLLRTAGDATFGVFLVHFAILVALRELGWREDSVLSVCGLIALVALAAFAVTLLGKKLPGLRAIL